MVLRTAPVSLSIARSSVDVKPIHTTCGTDQQEIRSSLIAAEFLVHPIED